jgi:hypothetical protein
VSTPILHGVASALTIRPSRLPRDDVRAIDQLNDARGNPVTFSAQGEEPLCAHSRPRGRVRTQRGRWLRKERRNEGWEHAGATCPGDLRDLIVHMPRTAAQRRKHVNHPTYCCALEINASREYGCVPSVANEGICKQENGWGRCVCVGFVIRMHSSFNGSPGRRAIHSRALT